MRTMPRRMKDGPLRNWLLLFEREYIRGLLLRHGTVEKALDYAQVDRRYFQRLMKYHKIQGITKRVAA
jgi:hypothetical protein